MNWHDAIGILSTLALFTPVFIIVVTKLIRYKQYFPLFIYCLLAFGFNLMTEHLVSVPKSIERFYGITNNLTDMPLMLGFLLFQIPSSVQRKRIKILLGAFIVFEIVLIFMYGITVKTITLTMGPGLAIVFGYSLYYFVYTVKRSFIHDKFVGKAIIASALTFAYGCFIILYLMHYVLNLKDLSNLFLVYYFVTIIYCLILSVGLNIEGKRKRKLHELLITRKELMSIPDFGAEEEGTFVKEKKLIANLKKAILMASGAAVQKLMAKIENEQEVLMNLADMAIETFNAESVLLRVMKMVDQKGEAASANHIDIMRTYLYDAADNVNKFGKDAINSFSEGDEQRMILMGLKRFTKAEPFNTKDARRRIADKMISEGKYCF